MTLSIKQQLLAAGMDESEIDHWSSDLYVLKNEISTEWLMQYEFKNQVIIFRSETPDYELWYEIPFGYMPEYLESKNR